jgi:hypothetical protein
VAVFEALMEVQVLEVPPLETRCYRHENDWLQLVVVVPRPTPLLMWLSSNSRNGFVTSY